MSHLIGTVNDTSGTEVVYVHSSLGGVEVHADPQTSFSPAQARAYAELLRAAADRVERTRADVESEIAVDPAMARVHSVTPADIAGWHDAP
jgi:hypothetical protein